MSAITLSIHDVVSDLTLERAYELLCEQRKDRSHNNSIWDLRHKLCFNGLFFSVPVIPKGCPLSPQMAALYLKPLDDAFKNHGFYVRFMDDWVIMVRIKEQLRKVVRITHQVLKQLKCAMHPDKTFIGPIKRGFNFLGIDFNDKGASLSQNTIHRHQQQIDQRYAQGVSLSRIGTYCKRWLSWALSILRAVQAPIETTILSLLPAPYSGLLEVNLMEIDDEKIHFGSYRC